MKEGDIGICKVKRGREFSKLDYRSFFAVSCGSYTYFQRDARELK